jgi:hypothetical protein
VAHKIDKDNDNDKDSDPWSALDQDDQVMH